MTKRTTSYILTFCLVIALLTSWLNTWAAAPKPEKGGTLITYYAYEVMYNPEYRIPVWVQYTLTAEETDGPYSRSGLNFGQDPSLALPQAEDSDYRNSGWSRGHMAPAGDFKWSGKAMAESFYFTNCCPQDISLNNGQWKTLEEKVRGWANRFGSVTVVTGPLIIDNAYGTIGRNKVVVPDAFFKAVLAGEQCIAFVMYNKSRNENLQKCAMSVDRLEEISGIDFFPELKDKVETRIEAVYDLKYWGL
ncbi:MAG: DNA/RNA non-specific endonuclease [Candidatus Cryptobacteroides sp.]